MTSVEKLVQRLRAAGYPIPDDYKFQRHYPGYWQRSSGGWSWSIRWINGEVGSCHPVKEMLRAKSYSDGAHNEIYAEQT